MLSVCILLCCAVLFVAELPSSLQSLLLLSVVRLSLLPTHLLTCCETHALLHLHIACLTSQGCIDEPVAIVLRSSVCRQHVSLSMLYMHMACLAVQGCIDDPIWLSCCVAASVGSMCCFSHSIHTLLALLYRVVSMSL